MSSISLDDRAAINTIHGLGRGSLGTPAQLRDASNPLWKRNPTKISPPSNPSRTPSGHNPFSSGRVRDNLHATRSGNPTAQKTVVGYATDLRNGPPPSKKARTDSPPVPRSSRKKVSQQPSNAGPSRSRQRLGDPDNTDVIIVDDEYEDVGQPILRTIEPDDLNIRPGPSGSSRRDSNPLRPVPDGAATTLLREQRKHVPLAPEDDSDPIESDPEPAKSYPGPGNVKAKINVFEGKAAAKEKLPHIDFTELKDKPKISAKERMKGKNKPPSNPIPMVAPANNPLLKPNHTTKPQKKPNFLPIKAWYLGRKFFDEPYHLLWDPVGKIIIRSGDDPGAKVKHTEEIDLRFNAKQVSYVPPNDSADKIFGIQTFEKLPKNKTKDFGTQFSAYFKRGGTHGEGNIVLKFDSASSAWADTAYAEFIEFLQRHVEAREKLIGKAAGKSKWELAGRVADMFATRARRESGSANSSTAPEARAKTPAVAGIPALDTWSPPSTLAIANTTKTASRAQHEGSPDEPIEVGSPTPQNKYTDYTGGGGLRRSARQSVAPQRPQVDPDEVILVYPQGQTGAVNITNGDLSRLAPGEFLNDTLIEFGLKLWLHDLEKENPELVKQIHVFSSFFYKKLDNKDVKDKKNKSPEKGYESVRKWTAKFNLFDKKYVIVPINENLHWYLAIIYQPEHTLKPPLPPKQPTKSPATRQKTRIEAERSPELGQVPVSRMLRPVESRASSVTRRTPSPIDTTVSVEGGRSGTLSPISNLQAEAEVVDQLVTACSITDDADDAPLPETTAEEPEARDTDGEKNSLFDGDSLFDDEDERMDVDGVDAAAEQLSPPPPEAPLNDGGSHTASEEPVERDIMDIDADIDPDESMDPLLLTGNEVESPPAASVVKTGDFYGSAKSRGKRKAQSPARETISLTQDSLPVEEAEADEPEVEVIDGQPLTHVFILDSLGGRHLRVCNVLGQYLQLEAREKQGIAIENSRKSVGKQAQVPQQPNFCDCGIYLLHLAQTFISDPEHYFALINKKKGTVNSVEREKEWKNDQTKTLRQSLADRIKELSLEWKNQKELKKTKKEESVPESSDDDVDIVETTPAVPPRHRKAPPTGRAMRIR
ncbi:hypothetical protein MSAN_01885500 [Mycena sanguinolenta]|uniref:Ubiquitin-like protease family profile domain-containing protein n=1 Tax=Mycena sanguinolenta TaxID=230812 RepID=A0A8H6XTR0_9AGAR|nr:hypothetical protein MSAN_01885500 [Mycena sanguinolenta]